MHRWPWIERTFNFDFPTAKAPDLIERLRGTPVRVAALLDGVPAATLTQRADSGWTIQENVGHLADTHRLMLIRLDELLAGAATLTAADIESQQTHAVDHNNRPLPEVLAALHAARARLVDRLEACTAADWARTAHHPRLKRPMRLVDLACFCAEHDDYHLARIHELLHQLGRTPSHALSSA